MEDLEMVSQQGYVLLHSVFSDWMKYTSLFQLHDFEQTVSTLYWFPRSNTDNECHFKVSVACGLRQC